MYVFDAAANVLQAVFDAVPCTKITKLLVVGQRDEPRIDKVAKDVVNYGMKKLVDLFVAAEYGPDLFLW